MTDTPPEVNPNDWELIINDSESGVSTQMNKSQVKATEKLVLSVVNLRFVIANLQKSFDKFNSESSKLYKVYIWLTAIIAGATLANVA